MSVFGDHVLHVVAVCSCEEVVWVDALWVVAGVADDVSCGYFAFVDGVGEAVG